MANNPTLLTRPLAEDGQKNTIPDTTDATSGLFSQRYGWQSTNSLPLQAGGKAVKREDFNGAFNLLGGIAFMAQKGFTFKWSSEQDYYAGCVVIDDTDGLRYECIADVTANSTAPSADATHWQIFKAGTDIDAWFRQASTVYAVGDLRCYESLPYGWYLECTTAGTTSSGDITLPSPIAEKDTVTDGTVVWTIRKIGSGGDGVPLGAIIALAHNSTIPAGYLLCDGSAVSRTMYPDLYDVIGTTYGAGDGSTTFNVPDANQAKRFLQGDVTAGTVKSAGLPNIEGALGLGYDASNGNFSPLRSASGAFELIAPDYGKYPQPSTATTTNTSPYAALDASRSSSVYGASTTVQPPALTVRYIIKAFDGQSADSALIDITHYAQDLANKADRDLDNLSAAGEAKIANIPLTSDFTIIYPNGGTAANPANVTVNTRYVETNPFPGYYITCIAEILYDNSWADPRWGTTNTIAAGAAATQENDNNIVIQTGSHYLINTKGSWQGGTPFQITGTLTSAPCRVKVWKIGKIPTN